MVQDIAHVFQQCDPAEALPPYDRRYVGFENTRGEGNPVMQLTNAIRWSKSPLHMLFAGHRGGGKSTELLRLKRALENPAEGEPKFFVVYFEADAEDVDVNDADFPDLLLAMIRHAGQALREQEKMELQPSWMNRFFDELKGLLGSELEFQKLEFDAKIAKFTAAIKSSPDVRQKIRKALEPNVSNLIQEANKLFEEIIVFLRGREYQDLVLIVDALDRIVLRDIPGSQFNTHEQLFINRGDQLTQICCHIVYTLPVSMVFTPKGTILTNIFGRQADVLPMVKIAGPDCTDHLAGMDAMREMVRRRFAAAEVECSTAFDSSETLDYLCRMSGGHVRNLLILLRQACTASGALPLTREVIERSVRRMSTDFERALNNPEFFEKLREVERTHKLPGSAYDQLLLYNLSLLEYLNGNAWYSVNPPVRLLEKFQPPIAPAKPSRRRSKRRAGA